MTHFSELNLPLELNESIKALGFETPTPIQAQSIPIALEGKDILACAQTGTGKTAAFAIPIITNILKGSTKQTLVLAPTRELAEQIMGSIQGLTSKTPQIKTVMIIGGKKFYAQEKQLKMNPHFIVATPGRFIDHMGQKNVNLKNFNTLILDEADRMLDMGFGPQLDKIVAFFPTDRQTLLFSATIPIEIKKIAMKYMKNPVSISVSQDTVPLEKIKHTIVNATAEAKNQTLITEIDKIAGSIIIFTRTKSRTERVAKILSKAGHEVTLIHGDRSQNQRSRAIEGFKDGTYRILVATDIAARGLDIRHIEHVINFDLPMCAEDYVHRIGRTARAGAEGSAIAFVTPQDAQQWAKINKLLYGKSSEINQTSQYDRSHREQAKQDKIQRHRNSSQAGSARNNNFKPRNNHRFGKSQGGNEGSGSKGGWHKKSDNRKNQSSWASKANW